MTQLIDNTDYNNLKSGTTDETSISGHEETKIFAGGSKIEENVANPTTSALPSATIGKINNIKNLDL